MTTHQSKRSPMGFILGLIIGILIMGVFWYSSGCKHSEDQSILNPPKPIPLDEAKIYYNNYSDLSPTQFKSLPFSRDQIQRMHEISLVSNNNYFNFYKGVKTETTDTLTILVGFNKKGVEDKNQIYTVQSNPVANSPCPTVCDQSILN